jgi:hypothetical protein
MGQATSVETPFAPAFFGRSARRAPRNGGRRPWQGRASARRRTTGSRAVELVAGLSNDEAAEPWRFGAGARQTLPNARKPTTLPLLRLNRVGAASAARTDVRQTVGATVSVRTAAAHAFEARRCSLAALDRTPDPFALVLLASV